MHVYEALLLVHSIKLLDYIIIITRALKTGFTSTSTYQVHILTSFKLSIAFYIVCSSENFGIFCHCPQNLSLWN